MKKTHKIKLAVSACLLGENVRYDGGNRRNEPLLEILQNRVDLLPVCPEVGAGLSIPRDPMQLTSNAAGPRLVVISSRADLTALMHSWAAETVQRLVGEGVCGFILKARSPSCAIADADLFSPSGEKIGTAAGLFSATLMAHAPALPHIDEEQFSDLVRREDFLERVRMYSGTHSL